MSKTLPRSLILLLTASVLLNAAAALGQGTAWPPPGTAGPVTPLWPEGVPRHIANGGPEVFEDGRGLLTPAAHPRILPPAPAGVVIEKDVAELF